MPADESMEDEEEEEEDDDDDDEEEEEEEEEEVRILFLFWKHASFTRMLLTNLALCRKKVCRRSIPQLSSLLVRVAAPAVSKWTIPLPRH